MTRFEIIKFRAELVLTNLKNCNSGAEIHEVNTMRGIAVGLIEMCDGAETRNLQLMEDMIVRLEAKTLDYFKKKFQHLLKGKKSDGKT